MAGLMVAACLLTQGAMVAGSLVVILIVYVIKINKWFSLLLIPLVIFGSIFVFKHQAQIISRMDGRSEVWKNTLSDIKNGQIDDKHKFCITGVGFGRFSFLFPGKHKSNFQQTHNDPLQFMYDCGFIGEYLLLAGIFVMLMVGLFHQSMMVFSIALSFLAIFFCSLGSFPFQLGAHQFYAAVLVGFLNNDKLIRGA